MDKRSCSVCGNRSQFCSHSHPERVRLKLCVACFKLRQHNSRVDHAKMRYEERQVPRKRLGLQNCTHCGAPTNFPSNAKNPKTLKRQELGYCKTCYSLRNSKFFDALKKG